MTVLDDFLQAAAVEVTRRATLGEQRQPVLAKGAAVFQRAVSTAAKRPTRLTRIGALDALASIDTPAATNPELASLAVEAAAEVPWIPTPRMDTDDGSRVGLGLVDQARDFGDVICGFMLLAPGAAYPVHHHAPQEVYLPIAGSGQWRYGGAQDLVALGPDALVYNNPNDVHTAVAADQPELALYFLWP